jgi:hypothetical protein
LWTLVIDLGKIMLPRLTVGGIFRQCYGQISV